MRYSVFHVSHHISTKAAMTKEFIYVANWKMNATFRESIDFATTNHDDLLALAGPSTQIVLCPSFDSITPLAQIFDTTPIAIGAQDCSSRAKGSYTGQVSAQSIHQVGCTHCIIGHSERRLLNHESNEEVAEKLIHLLDFDITPIVCIGELLEEYEAGKTQEVLTMQLAPLFETLSALPAAQNKSILLAYEPVWSIGTGKVASVEHLHEIFSWLASRIVTASIPARFSLLYGGSVSGDNAQKLKEIDNISGFLIGRASIDFQVFKKIVQ